jgi:hypothetical protein
MGSIDYRFVTRHIPGNRQHHKDKEAQGYRHFSHVMEDTL